jgi:hypothetical protein
MVYSRGARRGAESIRTALRMLKIGDVAAVKRLIRRAPAGTRFRQYVDASGEAAFDAGIADAFLHPRTRTYRIDEFMALVGGTGLTPLMFAHAGALPTVPEEVARLRRLEGDGEETPNFILYLGRQTLGGCGLSPDARLMLNPALRKAVSPLNLAPVVLPPRLGRPNPRLGLAEKRFLRRFVSPTPVATLTPDERERARPFLDALFLVAFR